MFDKNEIKKFDIDEKDYFLLKMAIKFHNKLQINENYIKDELNKQANPSHTFEDIILYCKLIRDADKLDLLYLIANGKLCNEIKTFFNKDGLSKDVLKSFNECQLIPNQYVETKLDRTLSHLAFLYDINFNESLKQVNIDNYLFGINKSYGQLLNSTDYQMLQSLLKDIKNNIKEKVSNL